MMSKQIRILHVVGSLGIGGIQSYLMDIYRHIDRNKIQFDFVIHIKTENNYVDEVQSLGGKVFYIDGDAFEKKAWRQYVNYWRCFFRNHSEYKIIHGHLRSTAAIYLMEAKKTGCYTIAHSHATSNGYGISGIIKNILQYPTRYISDYCMGCSQQANDWMFGRRKARSKTCIILRNGIDVKRFLFNEKERSETRTSLGIEDASFVIGTVGRLVEQKNQKLLIQAFSLAIQTRRDLMLLIIGDGPLRKQLYELTEKLGISNKVKFLGSRNDVDKLMQAFDLFATSSVNEGLGIAIIEAQAADLPVVVSPAIPQEAYITEKIRRMNDYSVDTWKNAMLNSIVTKRNDRSAEIRKAGYDIHTIADELSEFYYAIYTGEIK